MASRLSFLLLLSAAVLPLSAQQAMAEGLTTFAFDTLASRNAAFDRSTFVYPETHDLAGQINPNVGDVRLDGVSVDGTVFGPEALVLVAAAHIVEDTGVDTERGGGNVTAGYGLGADLDPLIAEGIGSVTPTDENVAGNHGNLNLTSIVAVRENVGTTSYELSFERPVGRVLLWERGNSGDVQVEGFDETGAVVGSLLLLDGANDDGPSAYTPTGIVVTTFVQDGFLNQGQELSSVGLAFDRPVTSVRFTALQEAEAEGAVRYNGPDLKAVGLAG